MISSPHGLGTRRIMPRTPSWKGPRANRPAARSFLLHVAVGDRHREAAPAQVAGQGLGERHRPVAAAGAADGDREVALPFADVLRDEERQEVEDPLAEGT